MIKRVSWFVFFAVLALSCLDNPDCYNLNNDEIGISFRKMADNRADTVALIAVVMDGTDSIFYENKLVNGVQLPLNYLANQTTIYFHQPDGPDAQIRRLVLGYNSKAQYVSEDCGERFVLSDLMVVSSDFDSARILSPTPTRSPSTNVALYRCPITNVVRFSFRQLYTDTVSLGKPVEVYLDGIAADYTADEFYPGQSVSSVRLPINPLSPTTQFTFNFGEDSSNMITLNYRAVELTRFVPCGSQEFFTDISIAQTDFPFVKILKDSIQDPPVTNVAFLKCPETNFVGLVFRESSAENAATKTVTIARITTDYSDDEFYVNSTVSSVTLPLNDQSDATIFNIEFEDGVKNLELRYDRAEKVYHGICNQTEFSVQQVVSSDFTAIILDKDIKFPTVNNLAVVIN